MVLTEDGGPVASDPLTALAKELFEFVDEHVQTHDEKIKLDRLTPDEQRALMGSGSAADHAASLTGERRGLSVRAMPSSQRSLSASARS
jgi:hypothetical protein